MTPTCALLPCGQRLHLQHGPIDLIIGTDGSAEERSRAFHAAENRFQTVLSELVQELPLLRAPVHTELTKPVGHIGKRMYRACAAHRGQFVTPMAAVAGAVADTLLNTMILAVDVPRAYVNNGGDIALHLGPNQSFKMAIQDHNARTLGTIQIAASDSARGLATSGRHGRSLSCGIADSVTVLASNAASADVAATLIANAVDLPAHPAISRQPASDLDPDSDLKDRKVVTGCARLSDADVAHALEAGKKCAIAMQKAGLIEAAALFLQDQSRVIGSQFEKTERSLTHA